MTCVILPRGSVILPRTRGGLTRCGLLSNTCNFSNSVTVSGLFMLCTDSAYNKDYGNNN